MLLFWREPGLPVDLLLDGDQRKEVRPDHVWLAAHQDHLQCTWQKAGEHLQTMTRGSTPHLSVSVTWSIFVNGFKGGTKYRMPGSQLCLLLQLHSPKIQDPFTVNQADGTGLPKRVHRAELQLCPVGFSFPQIPSESAAEPSNHQGLSSTDTDSELLLLLNPWRTLAATRQHLEPVSLWMPTATRRTCSCTNKSVSQQHWWNSVRCSSNTLQKDSTKEDNTCYNRQAQESTQTVAVSM